VSKYNVILDANQRRGIQIGDGNVQVNTFDGMSLETVEPEVETRWKYTYDFKSGDSSYTEEDVEVVTVTLVVPEQSFQTTYPKDEWEEAVKNKTVGDLTDWWRSDIDSEIDSALLGPDGNVVPLW